MEFTEYQALARRTAVYRESAETRLARVMYCSLGLASEAGEVAGQAKRILRDDNEWVTDERTQKLKDEIGDVIWYCAMLADELGLNLENVVDANVQKLRSRFERGVIQGEGGER